MATTLEGEDRVMAAAQRIVQSLNNTPDNVREDMISIFSSFDNRLSNITDLMSGGGERGGGRGGDSSKVDARFQAAEKVILRWDSNGASSRNSLLLPWEDSPDEAAEYLAAVDEILQLTEDLTIQSMGDIMDRADSALQLAMSRLEDEFRHILIRSTLPLDADRLYGSIRRVSLSLDGGEIEEDDDFESSAVDDVDDDRRQASLCLHERGASLGDDVFVELINSDAMEELRDIADRMIRSGYEKECCQVYSSVRRDVLDECMTILGVEKLSIEEVQRIEWGILDEKMKKWVQALKVVVRVLLAGEKRLCEQIFSESELTQEVCFVETAKGCVMQLLNFGEAVVIGRRSSEKLFRILDMYDVMFDVLPDLEALFTTDEYELGGELVCSEAKVVLSGLGEAAIGTFVEFENAVLGETSRKPMQGGEIHPLTRYVMNYTRLLVDYRDSLNVLLGNDEDHKSSSRSQTATAADDDDDNLSLQEEEEESERVSPIAIRLLRLITSLESNIEEKSRMYDDNAMQYIFLMNNILYMVQKVKDSDLRNILGDQWIRKRRGQVRQYATSYLRASWSKVLSCLKDEGIGGGGGGSSSSTGNASSKVALKERFKNFNASFEDIYRIQTGWKVTDVQLREELRISISEKVLPAYRSFMGRFGSQLESGRHAGKYIKFTPDDLETYLLDLFEGTPIILNHMRRKSS